MYWLQGAQNRKPHKLPTVTTIHSEMYPGGDKEIRRPWWSLRMFRRRRCRCNLAVLMVVCCVSAVALLKWGFLDVIHLTTTGEAENDAINGNEQVDASSHNDDATMEQTENAEAKDEEGAGTEEADTGQNKIKVNNNEKVDEDAQVEETSNEETEERLSDEAQNEAAGQDNQEDETESVPTDDKSTGTDEGQHQKSEQSHVKSNREEYKEVQKIVEQKNGSTSIKDALEEVEKIRNIQAIAQNEQRSKEIENKESKQEEIIKEEAPGARSEVQGNDLLTNKDAEIKQKEIEKTIVEAVEEMEEESKSNTQEVDRQTELNEGKGTDDVQRQLADDNSNNSTSIEEIEAAINSPGKIPAPIGDDVQIEKSVSKIEEGENNQLHFDDKTQNKIKASPMQQQPQEETNQVESMKPQKELVQLQQHQKQPKQQPAETVAKLLEKPSIKVAEPLPDQVQNQVPLEQTNMNKPVNTAESADAPNTLTNGRRFPNAIIIGAVSCPVNVVVSFLNLHQDITMAGVVNFFNDETNYKQGLSWYTEQMPMAKPEQVIVDVNPTYYFASKVPQRIKATKPDTKLIFVVCDPIMRALAHQVNSSISNQDIKKALLQATKNGQVNERNEAIQFSLYFYHLQRWLRLFPRKQLLIIDVGTLRKNLQNELFRIESFLGVGHKILSSNPDVDPDVKNKLKKFFQTHNEEFFKAIGQRFEW